MYIYQYLQSNSDNDLQEIPNVSARALFVHILSGTYIHTINGFHVTNYINEMRSVLRKVLMCLLNASP